MLLPAPLPPAVRRRRLRPPTTVHAAPVDAPARVRRRDPQTLTTRAFPQSLALRRVFGAGGAENGIADLVRLLSAPTAAEAAEAAGAVAAGPVDDDAARRALAELREVALGAAPHDDALWGDTPALDALRLRALRAPQETQGAPLAGGRFLSWAGARLDVPALHGLPPSAARVVTAALAASRGYRGAFLVLALRVALRLGGSFAAPLSIVALRCALEGVFLPAFVALLLPAARRRQHTASGRDPWAAALLALRAYREGEENVAGFVHLAAALLASDLRERVLLFADREAGAVLRRRWWSALPAEADGAMASVVALLRAKSELVTSFTLTPWPRGWGGPDFRRLLEALTALLGPRTQGLALELLLDDRLTVAALFALVGYGPSAEALLAQAAVHPSLREAREAVGDAVHRRRDVRDPGTAIPELAWGPEAARLLQRLRATPEPSVELGSPHWMLGEQRGALMSRLIAEGKGDVASAVRPVLDRADLRRDLEPFWLLRGGMEDTRAVEALAAWLAARETPSLAPAEWISFAEEFCRRRLAT